MTTTTEWARENGQHARWHCAADNYDPPRNYAGGDLWFYDLGDDPRGSGIVLDGADQLRDNGRNAVYLVDDGRTVAAYYVAAWHSEETHLILHPMPTNYDANGARRTRADDGREVDYGAWTLGSRTAYHLKVVVDALARVARVS